MQQRWNASDKAFVGVHAIMSLLLLLGRTEVAHLPGLLAYNGVAVAAVIVLVHLQGRGKGWAFAHDWLPSIFFITVFEELALLSLSIRAGWHDALVARWDAHLPPISPTSASPGVTELLAFGYAAFYPLYPVVAGLFWAWRKRARYRMAFREVTDAITFGYLPCYAVYVLLPTRSPLNIAARVPVETAGGVFHPMMAGLQHSGGVHGNAFPSGHIMLSFAVLIVVWKYAPRLAPALIAINLLMMSGAVYFGYHWEADVLVGAPIGALSAWLTLRRSALT